MKFGIYCYVTAGILTNILQKCFLSSPLTNISFLSKPLNLIGYHGNRTANLAKNKNKKIISSEAIRGIKLKLCRNLHNINRYKNGVFYCRCSCFHCYISIDLQAKIENWLLLLTHCSYFDTSFTEIFLE